MFRVAERNNLIANAFEKIEQLYMLLNENVFFENFGITIPEYCYTNFKDALFHYHKMIVLENENALFDQFYAISEHVSRAKTDLYLNALLAFSFGIEKLLMEEDLSEAKSAIRECLHSIKRCIYSIRFGGMRIASSYDKVDDIDIESCLQNAIEIIESKKVVKSFMGYINEAMENASA